MKRQYKAYHVEYFVAFPGTDGGYTRCCSIYARSKTHAHLIAQKMVTEEASGNGRYGLQPGTTNAPPLMGIVVKVRKAKKEEIE